MRTQRIDIEVTGRRGGVSDVEREANPMTLPPDVSSVPQQKPKHEGSDLTVPEIMALREGDEVVVTWMGGNGPHRYVVYKEATGEPFAGPLTDVNPLLPWGAGQHRSLHRITRVSHITSPGPKLQPSGAGSYRSSDDATLPFMLITSDTLMEVLRELVQETEDEGRGGAIQSIVDSVIDNLDDDLYQSLAEEGLRAKIASVYHENRPAPRPGVKGKRKQSPKSRGGKVIANLFNMAWRGVDGVGKPLGQCTKQDLEWDAKHSTAEANSFGARAQTDNDLIALLKAHSKTRVGLLPEDLVKEVFV